MDENVQPAGTGKNEAQQFHDTICQSLTAMSVTLDVFQRRSERGQAISAEDLQQVRTLLDQVVCDAGKWLKKLESARPDGSAENP